MDKNKIAINLSAKLKDIDNRFDDTTSKLLIVPSTAWNSMFLRNSIEYENEQKKRTSLDDRVKFHKEIVELINVILVNKYNN
jgi:hypothetical protein